MRHLPMPTSRHVALRRLLPVFVGAVLLAGLLSCEQNTEPEAYYHPACGAAKIILDPATGVRTGAPPEAQPEPIPDIRPEDLPDDESVRVEIPDGLWRMHQDVIDEGYTSPDKAVRILISLPMRKREELNQWLERVYNPASEVYLNFISASCFTAEHGPSAESVAIVTAWLKRHGFEIRGVATNRMLLIAAGTVQKVEETFGFKSRRVTRVQRLDFAAKGNLSVPDWLYPHIDTFIAMQSDRTNTEKRDDEREVVNKPYDRGVTPWKLAKTYGVQPLYDQGYDGRGQTIAVVVGWDARRSDIASYFTSYGIERAGDIEWKYVDAIPHLYSGETTIDIQMAGGAAPGADLIVYLGADNTDFSLTWAINEAVGEGRSDLITYSYSHQEVITAWQLQAMQSLAARIAAAQGITFLAASGDSRNVDNPPNSPWVTAVGATFLVIDENGDRVIEQDTTFGGLGRSALFAKPEWQRSVDPASDRRATVDLALHCNPFPDEHALTGYIYGRWLVTGGTSLAAPMLAGYLAVVNQARGEKGQLGFINRTLYTNRELQATFFDVTDGMVASLNRATVGWDFATGWGSPRLDRWVDVIP